MVETQLQYLSTYIKKEEFHLILACHTKHVHLNQQKDHAKEDQKTLHAAQLILAELVEPLPQWVENV